MKFTEMGFTGVYVATQENYEKGTKTFRQM